MRITTSVACVHGLQESQPVRSLIQFQIGSNDIRKVEETLTSHLYILNIADNPNISIDVTSVCAYIKAGMYKLFYDKNQDIRGCDALDLEN